MMLHFRGESGSLVWAFRAPPEIIAPEGFFFKFLDLEHWTSNNPGRDLLLEETITPDISGEELAYSVFKGINM